MDGADLTSKAYWAREAGRLRLCKVETSEFAPILETHLPFDPGLRCVEIGAYPGSNLCYLSKRFGYRPTAIEYRDDAEDMAELFAHNGVEGLTIINRDFREVSGLTFDVVVSFGFVEHFADSETIIGRHAELVARGGYLVVSVPHFWGLQGLLRRLLFRRAELDGMLMRHNTAIMNKNELTRLLVRHGMRIVHADYFMGIRFWVPWDSPRIRPGMRRAARLLNRIDRSWGGAMPPCRLYSPMIVTISRKA